MRCLADFILDSDLCLPVGTAPLTLNDPAGRFALTLSNASEAELAVPEAVLSAQVIFETNLTFPDERREIDELACKWLAEALNVLAFTTNRKFIPRTLKRLVDWTPGLIQRDAMIYTETPEWDLAEPELSTDYIGTAERILAMQAGPEHQAAMRWHRIAVQEGVPEQQFSYFWFALEIVAEAMKGAERVPSARPRCRAPLYCEQCQNHPTHRRYPGEAIQDLVLRVHPQQPDEVFEILQKIRHTLMHGGRIADIPDLPCSDQQAVNKLGTITWNALALMTNKAADPQPETPLTFGVPEHYVRRKLVATVHMRLGPPIPTTRILMTSPPSTLKPNTSARRVRRRQRFLPTNKQMAGCAMTENLSICRILSFAALAASMIFTLPARSQVPCDFKGISVGDKLTREQVMERLGIKKFKLDPPRADFMEMQPEIDKYGITGAAEREDDKTGPYCREDSCNIPYGVVIGDDKIPVKVFVALKANTVYAIEIYFNTIFWNDVWKIMVKKYGPMWEIERSLTTVMDYGTKKVDQIELVSAIHKLGGINRQNSDTCSISAGNIDLIFRHHDSLGSLHAFLALKREAKDF